MRLLVEELLKAWDAPGADQVYICIYIFIYMSR